MNIGPGARIAVTGGSGFIGSEVVSLLLASGYSVRVLSRAPNPPRIPGCDVKFFDLARPEAAEPGVLTGCDALVHLAAHIPRDRFDIGEAEACFRINAVGTLNLFELAARAGVLAVAHAGAGNAYAPGILHPTEDSPLFPASHAPFYLTSKVAAEIFGEYWALGSGIRLSCLRLGSVYGSGYSGIIGRWVDSALQGEPIRVANGGSFGADFVTGADVAVAFADWLGREVSGPINIGSGVRHTLLDVANSVVEAADASADILRIDPFTSRTDHGFEALDIGRAVQLLSFSPTSMAAGVRRMVDDRRVVLSHGR